MNVLRYNPWYEEKELCIGLDQMWNALQATFSTLCMLMNCVSVVKVQDGG